MNKKKIYIEFTTILLKLNLCNFSDSYMVVKGIIIGIAGSAVIFKNVFTAC